MGDFAGRREAMKAVSTRIHPSALLSADASLAPDVVVGASAVIEGKVTLGPGCVVRPQAHLIGPLTMGANNQIYSGAVIGERPQHMQYADEPTGVIIGDNNVFHENVTVNRATAAAWQTRIGADNVFMPGSHVAHDCVVGSRCYLGVNALMGGHSILEDQVHLAGNCALHQFCRMGRLSVLASASISTKDVPPFISQQNVNTVTGINEQGMRQAGLSDDEIEAIRRAYQIVFLEGLILPAALKQLDETPSYFDVVRTFVAFLRTSKRGINLVREERSGAPLAA